MKKLIFILTILGTSIFSLQINSMSSLQKFLGSGNQGKQVASNQDVDTVAFWSTVVNLLNGAGYNESSEFGKHARTNLKRVQTLHGVKGEMPSSSASDFLSSLTKQSREAKPKTLEKAKKAQPNVKVGKAKRKHKSKHKKPKKPHSSKKKMKTKKEKLLN